METCKHGSGAGSRKPTAEMRQGAGCRAYELDRVIKEKQTVTIYSNKIVLSGYLNSSYNIIKSWETNSNFFFDCIKDNTVYRFMEHKHLDTITFYLRDLNKETYMFFNDNTF